MVEELQLSEDFLALSSCGIVTESIPEDLAVKHVVIRNVEAVANAKGFYRHTTAEARSWEKKFLKFSYEVCALAQKYRE